MKGIEPGDTVRIIDETTEGTVVRLLSDGMAEIRTADGWVIPAFVSKLVVIRNDRNSQEPGSIKVPARKGKPGDGMPVRTAPATSKGSARKPSARVIDLHIQRIDANTTGLTNSDIITRQLDFFRAEMNRAIREHVREVVFIHGIGNGRLRDELRRAGRKEFGWCEQEDASFRDFGFGATRFRIPHNKPR